jgi:hypothetical protein
MSKGSRTTPKALTMAVANQLRIGRSEEARKRNAGALLTYRDIARRADLAGLGDQTVQKILDGETGIMLEELAALAPIFGLTVSDVLRRALDEIGVHPLGATFAPDDDPELGPAGPNDAESSPSAEDYEALRQTVTEAHGPIDDADTSGVRATGSN